MTEALRKKKQQVVAHLEQRSASISNRIEAIESALPVPSKKVREIVSSRYIAKIGIGVVAGAIVGAFLLRSKGSSRSGFDEELSDVSASIGKEIRKNLSKGMDADDAVSRALKKKPPIVQLGGESGIVSGAVSQVFRQVAAALGPILADKLAERFRSRPDE